VSRRGSRSERGKGASVEVGWEDPRGEFIKTSSLVQTGAVRCLACLDLSARGVAPSARGLGLRTHPLCAPVSPKKKNLAELAAVDMQYYQGTHSGFVCLRTDCKTQCLWCCSCYLDLIHVDHTCTHSVDQDLLKIQGLLSWLWQASIQSHNRKNKTNTIFGLYSDETLSVFQI
jgi:hypothetical protein